MSRITKWKLDKTKVKVVFRLQFHATHVPQSGWDKLFISFIPLDSGKATAKTTKANVRNGICKWGDPIYETTRLLQDTKTKQYDEKLYKLVMAMGSSRSSVLGEATINLADYADALKPSVVALPLHGSDFGTILHVTVQLLTSKTGFREFEQQRELRERGLQTDQNRPDESSGGKLLSSEETVNDQMDKVNTRVRFKDKSKNLISLGEEVGPNEEYPESAVGFDGSSNTSGSLYAEKNDLLTTNEVDSLKSTVSGDLAGLSFGHGPQLEKGDPSDHRFLAQGATDWVHGWSSDYSADNDMAAIYEENSRLRGSLEVAESSVLELKLEVSSLQSHTEEIGHEAQKFAKQLAAEVASGEELAKEVSILKSECSNLKDDLEQLKFCIAHSPLGSREAIEAEQSNLSQDLQLRWLKGLLAMEGKIRELQNEASFGYHDRDFRFIHSELEALLGAVENLKQGTGLPMVNASLVPSEEESLKEIREMNLHKHGQFAAGTGFDVDSYQPELGMLHCLNISGLVSHEVESVDSNNAMKAKSFELLRELDESKAERESLVKKMGQMECYYEALVQELEENQRQMLGELQNLRNEHSTCLYTVSSAKSEMETVRRDLNDQILRLAEDKQKLDSMNNELERRAISAEASLKRARLNYSIAVEHLQRDLELLSFQVSSMFETNENLIKEAFVDPSQLNVQKFDSGQMHELKVSQFENQVGGIKKQQLGGDILSDDLKRALQLQEGLYRKVEGEVSEMHFVNLYLDVLSKTLQETLLEASGDVKLMEEKLNETLWQLELSTESKELLMQKLQTAIDDVQSLNDYKATCSDMALRNQILETNLQNATHENHLLLQKIVEWESLVLQYRNYESKYEVCAAEKTDLACLLEEKTLENGGLQNEVFSLQDELKSVRTEFDELASLKENLQNFINFVQNKLQNLLTSYEKCINGLHSMGESGTQDVESRDLTSSLVQLEKFQHNACEKILRLMEEKKGLEHERDMAQASFAAAESEIALMKEKFECDIRNMADKLDASNVLVQKLQLGVEAVANRLKVNSEVEDKYALLQTELFSDLDHLEVELQELVYKNRDLGHEILALETLTNELGRSKMTAVELTKKNQDLMASLLDKNEEFSKLASELASLKESLGYLQDENQALLASSKDKLEESAHLASELNGLKDSLLSLRAENQALTTSSLDKTEEAAKLASELIVLKESLQFLHEENQALMVSSHDKTEECAKLAMELNSLKESLRSLHDEKQALIVSERDQIEESAMLLTQLNSLKESLQSVYDEKQALVVSSQDKTDEAARLASELQSLKETLQSLHDEKQALVVTSQDKTDEAARLASELNSLKEISKSLHDEKQALVVSFQDKTKEAAKLASELNSLKESLQSLHDEKLALMVSSQDKTVEAAELASELNSLKESLKCLHDDNQLLMACSRDKSEESTKLASELNSLRESVQSLSDENQALKVFLLAQTEKCAQLASELNSLKICFQTQLDELQFERSSRESLEITIKDLTSRLDEKHCQLLQFDKHESELVLLKQLVSDLESEKSQVSDLLSCYVEESSSVATLEAQLSEMSELLMAADVRLIFTETQYENRVEELFQQLNSLDRQLTELHMQHVDVETNLNCCLSSGAQQAEEIARLLTTLNGTRSELGASLDENRLLLETNRVIRAELEEYKARPQDLESQHSGEVEGLRHLLISSEEQIDNLMSSNDELEVRVLVLKAALDEQRTQIISLEGYYGELMILQKQCNDLTQRLSEQTLKTEEFRNLSVHLKELKEKSDAECMCIQSREKREPEGPPVAMQESLRIAFIKEQYETRLQELKHQLSISKKHSEEMLWKLQDAIDEIENRKKSEASHLKKNEELGMNILDLEAELQSALADKREKMKAYDLMKAEMECSLISLECCKEEKQKLEASLKECNEEKSKITVELTLVKEKLENSKSAMKFQEEGDDGSCKVDCMSSGESVSKSVHEENTVGEDNIVRVPWNGPFRDASLKCLEQDTSKILAESEYACPAHDDEADLSSTRMNVPPEQDVLVSSGVNGLQNSGCGSQEKLLHSDMKHLALINDHFKAESLKSSMDHLRYELERMKNENSIILQDDHDFQEKFPGLQRELVQLQKANEELGSMYPLFNKFSGSGNALERVLALEIELAEALQAKKRSSIYFQSSFLKQHSDEEAIFKSFRDINELIKDMLELKGRYANVETELKEMHDRYSQLSLQFAEVEGERQKLMMTLKNVRASKRVSHLSRSSSAALGDHLS